MKHIPSPVAEEARQAIYPSLRGKRVVVTGGASGIGAGLVEAFAGQGADVVFVDILEKEGAELASRLAHARIAPRFQRLDLTDLAAMEAFFRALGGIDILVNNAANDDRHKLEDVTPAYWDERMAVNLRHMLFAAKAVAPGMKASGGGAIINFSSIAWHLGLEGLLLYETAKAIDDVAAGRAGAGDMRRRDMERRRTEGVGQPHPQRCGDKGQMHALAQGGIVQVVRRKCVAVFGNLLRGRPASHPALVRPCGAR